MLNVNVNLPIGTEAENRWMAMWGEDAVVFSLDTIKRIFEENPEEKDVRFNFNCDGGYVNEGLAIYDYIRTSGRNIYCNIESGCHSMAIVMLLAAPAENRTAQKHATSLIHCVRADICGMATAEELESAATDLKALEEKILNIYADRTGEDKEALRALMHEEKMRDTEFLLAHNFISKVNAYNTNQREPKTNQNINPKNTKTMAKTIEEALQMADTFVASIKNLLVGKATNYDHTDADGNVLFSTDAEDATLEVGMPASPDGTFELADGRTIVIADGVVTEIREAEPEDEETNEELETLRNQVNELTENVNALTEQLTTANNALEEASNVINELRGQLASNYNPKNVKRNTPAVKPEERTEGFNLEEHKAEMRAKLGLTNK